MTEVAVVGLRKLYAGAVAIEDVSLTAGAGELVTLLGPSGCGKTTTLRCIAGFMTPDGGDIRVDGRSIVTLPAAQRDFGVVFQNYALFPHLSVYENVAYGLRVRRIARVEERRRVGEALETVRLTGFETRLPRALSGGQQQRVALARALVIRPRLLLLDEPLANLDAKLRQEVRALIRDVQRAGDITAFYVTHDQAEAMAMSDRVAVMKQGKVVQFATPREIYGAPTERYVADFTGEANCLPARIKGLAGGDRYRVETKAGMVEARGPLGCVQGQAVTLLVRPEALTLLSEAAIAATNTLVGTLRSATFLGAAQLCEMEAGGLRLTFQVPTARAVVPGEPAIVAVDPAQAWLMVD